MTALSVLFILSFIATTTGEPTEYLIVSYLFLTWKMAQF